MNLGSVAFDSGDHVAAESYFRDSLALQETHGRVSSGDAATVMLELANLISHLRRYDESIDLLQRALRIERPALGEQHPRTIMESHSMAYALKMEGDFA